jgi:DNA/RNA endonuclease YhcR with UshA esterase domain
LPLEICAAVNIRKPHRALALLALLLACAGVGAAQQSQRTRASDAAQPTARSYLFVSPNTQENLTLPEALRKLDSTEEMALILDGRTLSCRLNLQARIVKTIGSWTDGAEHSTMLLVHADEETARYAEAWLGRRARQKSVLYFQQRARAPARMYVLSLQRRSSRALASVAQALDRSGVTDRTLVPGARRTLIYVVDFKNELQRRVFAAARRLGARYRVLAGTGDFIGAERRDEAQTVFAEIVSKYAQAHPPVENNCGAAAAPQAMVSTTVVSIAEARRLPLGTVATIEGVVTVPSGIFKSSISDEGFAVQDRSAGIYVRMSETLSLRVRERVRVTGRIDESNGLLAIVPAGAEAIKRRGRGAGVAAQRVATGNVNEATEGRLVKVKGMLTRAVASDLPYGSRLFINDGTGEVQVYVSASTKIDVSGFRAGQRFQVTGFSGHYKDHYEVEPRFSSDIIPLYWKRRPAP